MHSLSYAINPGHYIAVGGGYGALSEKFIDDIPVPLSRKGYGNIQWYYQHSDKIAISSNIALWLPHQDILNYEYLGMKEKFSFLVASLDLATKIKAITITPYTHIYGQGGGWFTPYALKHDSPNAGWDLDRGYGLLLGFGFISEIKPNLLLDISYSHLFPLSNMTQTPLIRFGIGRHIK
jgi:hypothetical protein